MSDPSGLIARLASRSCALSEEALEAAAAITSATLWSVAVGYGDPLVEAWAAVGAALEPERGSRRDSVRWGANAVWNATTYGTAAAVCESADFHPCGEVELGPVVVAAAVAVGELTGSRYSDVIAGVAAGCEAALRLRAGLGPGHAGRGWEPSATCGVIGGAVAASRVLGADEETSRMALSLAATQAAGISAARGTALHALQFGHAAGVAVESALLAIAGLRGATAPLEGRRGLAQLMAPGADLERAGHDEWLVTGSVLKPFACAWEFQPLLAAALSLRGRVAAGDQMLSLTVRAPAGLLRANRAPSADRFAAQYDLRHCLALCLIDGHVSAHQFLAGHAERQDVAALRGSIHAVRTSTGSGDGSALTARLPSGKVVRESGGADWMKDAAAVRTKTAESRLHYVLRPWRTAPDVSISAVAMTAPDLPMARVMDAVRMRASETLGGDWARNENDKVE